MPDTHTGDAGTYAVTDLGGKRALGHCPCSSRMPCYDRIELKPESIKGLRVHEHQAATSQTCPRCHAGVDVNPGYVTWCDRCGWNLQPQQPERPRTLLGALYGDLGKKLGKSQYERLRRAGSLRPTLTSTHVLAVLCATIVHLITLACLIGGVVCLATGWPNPVFLVLGLVLILLGVVLAPRLPRFPRDYLSRQHYPALYDVADEVADSLNSHPVDAIVLSTDFNASYRRAGWRRRQVLTLGLPLLTILDEREIVALIAHELAHGVNGDPARGLYVGSAINALTRWYEMLRPVRTRTVGRGLGALAQILAEPLLLLLAQAPRLGAVALSHLLWRDSQRAEYLADHLAARIAGTAAVLSLLEKLFLQVIAAVTVQNTAVAAMEVNLFAELRRRCADLPERERERLHRLARLEDSRLDATHPPSGLRIALLEAHPIAQPSVHLSALQGRALADELSAAEGPLQARLVDIYRSRLYFG